MSFLAQDHITRNQGATVGTQGVCFQSSVSSRTLNWTRPNLNTSSSYKPAPPESLISENSTIIFHLLKSESSESSWLTFSPSLSSQAPSNSVHSTFKDYPWTPPLVSIPTAVSLPKFCCFSPLTCLLASSLTPKSRLHPEARGLFKS